MNYEYEKVNIDAVRQTLKPLFDEYKIKKAILFGSTAKGLNNEKSDIDLVIDGNLKGLKFFGFLEKASNLFNNDIDLIEQSQIIKGSRMERELANTGVIIYGN